MAEGFRLPYRRCMAGPVQRIRDAVTRFFTPVAFASGSVRDAEGYRVRSSYPDEVSMAAVGRFPWVRAAARAKAMDLSSVPIVAVRTDPVTGERTRIPHPLVEALNRPGARRGGVSMRRQLYLDYDLTGDWYLWRQGTALFRLHPRRVEVIADPTLGIPVGYILRTHSGEEKRLRLEDVAHASDINWEDGPNAAIGTGAIVALHQDLSANLAVKSLTAKAAKRGRLEMLLSPKGDNALGDKAVRQLSRDFEKNREEGSAAFIVGRDIEATPLGLSPRDMEFGEQDLRTMHAILAVLGVPGIRVGIPGANYGTAKQQNRIYWEGLVTQSVGYDQALSVLVPDPTITFEHDFSRITALQQSYTERQAQARGWYEMGATAKAAAEYTGFVDAPLPDQLFADTDDGVFRRPEQEPEEGQERAVDVIARYLVGASKRYAERIAQPEWSSAVDEESLRLLVELERAGVEANTAMAYAERIAALNDEAALQCRLNRRPVADAVAFSRSRAVALANRLEVS
jgi:phage portal protein BeeE